MKFNNYKVCIVLSLLAKPNLSQSAHEHHHEPTIPVTSLITPAPDSPVDYSQQIPQAPRAPQAPEKQPSCSDSCSDGYYISCMTKCTLSKYMGFDNLVRNTGLGTIVNGIFGSSSSNTNAPTYATPSKQRELGPVATGMYTTDPTPYSHPGSGNHNKSVHPMKLTPTPLNPYDINTKTDWSKITVETYDLLTASDGNSGNSMGVSPTGTTISGSSATPLVSLGTDSTLNSTVSSKTTINPTDTAKGTATTTTKTPLTTTLVSGSLSLYNQNTNPIRISSTYLIFAISLLIVNL